MKSPNFGVPSIVNGAMSIEVAVAMLRQQGRDEDADALAESAMPGDIIEVRNGVWVVVNLSEPGF